MNLNLLMRSLLGAAVIILLAGCQESNQSDATPQPETGNTTPEAEQPKTDVEILSAMIGKDITSEHLTYIDVQNVEYWEGIWPFMESTFKNPGGKFLAVQMGAVQNSGFVKGAFAVPEKWRDAFQGAAVVEIYNEDPIGFKVERIKVCRDGGCVSLPVVLYPGHASMADQCQTTADCEAGTGKTCIYNTCNGNLCLPVTARTPCPSSDCRSSSDCNGSDSDKKQCTVGYCIGGPQFPTCLKSIVEVAADESCPPTGCTKTEDCQTDETDKEGSLLDVLMGGSGSPGS